MDARFAENLYEGMNLGGCGLLGFCDPFWYERHGERCLPGKWRVGIFAHETNGFEELLAVTPLNAVVDDFGELRRVPA